MNSLKKERRKSLLTDPFNSSARMKDKKIMGRKRRRMK
jgi:hypothetical protein